MVSTVVVVATGPIILGLLTIRKIQMKELQALSGLARNLALPGEGRPMRLPSFPALERTAVMSFNTSKPVDIRTGVSKAMLMRQASAPVWMTQHVDNVVYSYYRYLSGTTSSPFFPNNQTVTAFYNEVRYGADLGFSYSVGAPRTVVNGGRPLLAADLSTGPAEYIYVPEGFNMMMHTMATSVGSNLAYSIERWSSPGETVTAYTGTTGGLVVGGNYTPIVSVSTGWYRITRLDATSTGGASAVTAVGLVVFSGGMTNLTFSPPSTPVSACLPLSELSEWTNSRLPWSNTRLTAVSALFTNTTKALNKEGTVLWGRVAPEVTNVWSATSDAVNTLHPSEKRFMALEEGTYSYVMPSTDLALFWDYTNIIDLPLIRLENDSLVHLGFFTDPDGGTNLAVNMDWHVEFRTSSSLFQIGMSRLPVETLHQAQLLLLETGFFFKNQDHKSMITRAISAAARVSPVLQVLGPVGRGLASAAHVADSIMNRRNIPPRATTLQTTVAQPNKKAPGKRQQQKKSKQQTGKKRASGLDMYLKSRNQPR